MKRSLLLLALIAAAFAAQKPKPKAKPPEDPEARWICRGGSYHDCHCRAMMAEADQAWIDKCSKETDYAACMAKQPAHCTVIQVVDEKHPQHSCKRTCKAMAGCACEDGPVCKGPVLNQSAGEDPQ